MVMNCTTIIYLDLSSLVIPTSPELLLLLLLLLVENSLLKIPVIKHVLDLGIFVFFNNLIWIYNMGLHMNET